MLRELKLLGSVDMPGSRSTPPLDKKGQIFYCCELRTYEDVLDYEILTT